jgi:ABC-2 type transport system ATP-binding protein
MSAGISVEVTQLTKRFGSVQAVEGLSFTVTPGRVTGFLGPNGAGKTTTLRILLGLVSPTSGTATIGGRRYVDLADPLLTVGASLEATGFHAGRSARDHLRVLATATGLPSRRADEVLALVGLADVAQRRTGGFSMGMRQRLALAAALIGDPPVLLLDEPANGLDPEGIAWLRGFLRYLADQGRTVLISSHVLSEVQQTVDDVVIIANGRLIRQAPLAELQGSRSTLVASPTPDALRSALAGATLAVEPATGNDRDGATRPGIRRLRVLGATPDQVGAVAFRAGIELHELRLVDSDLESVFLALTATPQEVAR